VGGAEFFAREFERKLMLQVTLLLKSKNLLKIFSWIPLIDNMKYLRNHPIVLD